jgi:hypothetical protein
MLGCFFLFVNLFVKGKETKVTVAEAKPNFMDSQRPTTPVESQP